jgi:hypothetical protein
VDGPADILNRMENAVENVRRRLTRSANALKSHQVPYALFDSSAVAAWVATVDEAAVRNTQDVDILIRRADLAPAGKALESAAFVHRQPAGMDLFLDGSNAKACDAVHVVFANELVRQNEPAPNPDVTDSTNLGPFCVISLEALVRIKLTAFRRKDQVHLLDLIGVGLIDASWPARFTPALAARLQELLDNPES